MNPYRTQPSRSLPGFERRPRGLFIDRWGTLLEWPRDPASGDAPAFYAGAIDALFKAHRAGWLIYLIGNEDDVAQGRTSDAEWAELEAYVRAELEGHGVRLQRFYACLDHPAGCAEHARDSVFMLPNTGIFYQAAHLDGIELARSWVVGDSTIELVAGWRAGLRLAAVETGLRLADATFEVEPELVGAGLAQVLGTLLQAELVA